MMSCLHVVSGCLTLAVLVLSTVQPARAALLLPEEDDWPVLCPPLTYYSRTQSQCLACSKCPDNQIITSPCHGVRDTECGPFYNVDIYYPVEKPFPKPVPKRTEVKAKSGVVKTEEEPFNQHAAVAVSEKSASHSIGAKNSLVGNSQTGAMAGQFSHWEAITWAVCGAIALLVVMVIVGGIWIVRRKLEQHRKSMVCNYSRPPEEEV